MNRVAVIILHFGNLLITEDCLDSLDKIVKDNTLMDIYVLDNQGNLKLENLHKYVIVIKFTKNLGFAGGNNYIVDKINNKKYDYYLFLNNDTKVYPQFLVQLLKVAEKEEKIGIYGPVIEHQVGGNTYYDYAGMVNWMRSQPKHINRTEYTLDKTYYKRDFVSGCCMMIK